MLLNLDKFSLNHIEVKFFVSFSRTTLGFEFSESEPSALVQRQGGPCAVIAPVQAFLLKTILLETENSQNLSSVSSELIYAIKRQWNACLPASIVQWSENVSRTVSYIAYAVQ